MSDAALLKLTLVDYMVEEDAFAALCEDGGESEQVELVLAKRLLKRRRASRSDQMWARHCAVAEA